MPTDTLFLQFPHTVYRLFDKEGKLLYIGCSTFPEGRKFGHHAKVWYGEIDHMTTEPPRPYLEARAAEAAAIELECPPHNYAHQKETQRQANIAKAAEKYLATVARREAKWCRCPHCGGPKENKPGRAYCAPCYTKRRREWKLARGWVPVLRLDGLCKCGQPRAVSRSGRKRDCCNACKREENRKYREMHPKKR